jgi:hypothetical protein
LNVDHVGLAFEISYALLEASARSNNSAFTANQFNAQSAAALPGAAIK